MTKLVDTPRGPAQVHLHRVDKPRAGLVLGHGAGGGVDSPDLVGATEAANSASLTVALIEQPYRVAGRRAPAPARQLDEAWLTVVPQLFPDLPLIVGGRSLGARVACRTAAELEAKAVLCLAFPVHPPGKPERVRDEHLYRITVPMLFIEGTADPFAKPEIVRRVLGKLGRVAEHVAIEGGDHSFNVRGKKRDAREVGETLAGLAAPFVLRVAGAG